MTLRVNQEEHARELYSLARAELQRCVARQQAIVDDINGAFGRQRDLCGGSVRSEEIQQIRRGMVVLRERLRLAQIQVKKQQSAVDDRWRELAAARQKRELMEKLHDKGRAAHQLHSARAEQKALDDIATLNSSSKFALRWR